MALNDYAYYSTQTGLIENVLWIEDAVAPTLVWPTGYAIVDIPDGGIAGKWSMCGIGWSYINGQFVEPPNPTAKATLTANISSTDTVIPVDSTDTFYSSGYLTVDSEIMSYSGITTNSIIVSARGVNGTIAVEHLSGVQANSSQVMPKPQPQTTGSQNL
jgi:hypothetical protein